MILRAFCIGIVMASVFVCQTGYVAADTVNFVLQGRSGPGLLPDNENPSASGSGSGGVISGISYDTVSNVLTIDVGWGSGNGFTDMTGDATAMHIHGPADFNSNAGVLIGLDGEPGFSAGASDGGFDGSVTVEEANENDLIAGLLYINVHTSDNPGGELRGNLVNAIPEPGSAGFFVLAIGGLILSRRRR